MYYYYLFVCVCVYVCVYVCVCGMCVCMCVFTFIVCIGMRVCVCVSLCVFVPVLLKHNGAELRVNALLDDASTNSCVSSHVASEVGLAGEQEDLTVKVLSGRTEVFRTTSVSLNLSSIDRRMCMTMHAYTAGSVIRTSGTVNWQHKKQQWAHLLNVPFPALEKRLQIDVLVGLDCAELQSNESRHPVG